jgi:predicted kinase
MALAMDSPPLAPLIVISGAAGTGKTTLAHALAQRTGATVVDLDADTEDVLDTCRHEHPEWTLSETIERSREQRYSRLIDVTVRARASQGSPVISVAPFSLEIGDERLWENFVRRCGSGEVTLVWLSVTPEIRAVRLAERGELRDVGRTDLSARFDPPVVGHVAIDAADPASVQVLTLMSHFNNGTFN